MTNRDLLSHFNLTGLPFTKEVPVESLIGLPSAQKTLHGIPYTV